MDGLIPTSGLVSTEGVFPLSWSLDHVGPLVSSSTDAALLLGGLTGQTFQTPVGLKGPRFGVIQHSAADLEPEVAAVFEAACRTLEHAGPEVENIHIPELELADAALFNVLLPEAATIHACWMATRPEDYAPMTRAQLELGFALPGVTYLRAQQFRRRLTGHFLAALERVDALISPSVPFVAPAEDPMFTGEEGGQEGHFSVPHNLTGLPALSLKAGLGSGGLPVGLQLITRPHSDAFCLGLGAALEGVLMN